jgi:hypothetical protein
MCWISSWTDIGVNVLATVYGPVLATVASDQDAPEHVYAVWANTAHTHSSGMVCSYSSFFSKPYWHWERTSDYVFDDDDVQPTSQTPWRWEWTGPTD